MEEFANNTEWTDIKNWLATLESYLKQHPSPFINEKVLLSKRLNQCINPILPHKLHDQVLTIHETLFYNMRNSVDNDINEYRRLFAQDLGTSYLTKAYTPFLSCPASRTLHKLRSVFSF